MEVRFLCVLLIIILLPGRGESELLGAHTEGKSDGAVELKHQGGEGEAGGGPHVIPAEGSGGKTPTGGTDLIRKKPAGDHHLSSSHMMPVTRCIISLSVVLLLVHVAPYF